MKYTFTEYLDRQALRASERHRGKAVVVTAVFGSMSVLLAYSTLGLLAAGTPAAAGSAVGEFLLLGLFLPPIVLIGAVGFGWPAGRRTWISLVAGGALVAAGPILVLLLGGGLDTVVSIPQRYGPSGRLTQLSDAIAILWGLAVVMVVPGLLGLWRGRRRSDR